MNLQKFRRLTISTALCMAFGSGSDPFSQAGSNIFDKAAERDNSQRGNLPPSGATDYVPSQAVPGQRVPGTPADGEGGQLGHRATNTSQSPLASYMEPQYIKPAGGEGRGQPEGKPAGSENPPPKGAFDAELKDFDGIVNSQSFIRPEDAELAEKATKGDKQAMMDLLNMVSRRAVASSSFLATQVAKHGVQGELESYGKKLPTQLAEREFNTMFEGKQSGVLADQRTAALAPELANKFRREYPDAPPAAIKRAVENYLTDLTGYKPEEQKGSQQKENSWGDFFQS